MDRATRDGRRTGPPRRQGSRAAIGDVPGPPPDRRDRAPSERRDEASEQRELASRAAELGIELDPPLLADLSRYVRELRAWSPRMDLVSPRDLHLLVERHLLDALAAAPTLRGLGASLAIADLGSGAGLPGVPLAIVLRPSRMVLVEARRRRATFLRTVARILPGAALEVANCRIDAFVAREDVQRAFDAVVTRATLTAPELLRASAPLVRHGGLVIAYRGPRQPPAESFSSMAQPSLRWRVEPAIRYRLPGQDGEMRLDVWRAERAPEGS